MRNNVARFVSGPVCRWLIIGLTAVAFTGLFLAKSGAHEAHGFPKNLEIGGMQAINAVCDARAASEVAKADLAADSHVAGNEVFTRLAMADDPTCYGWGFMVPMEVTEITYVGTSETNLHVYIVKFGEDMYSVMTQRRDVPAARPAEADHKHGYDYEGNSV